MKTPICPTCGCSLVRLKISKDKAATSCYEGEEYHFCCQGCVDLFAADPETYVQRTKDLIVCPTCLGEKLPQSTFTFEHVGQEIPYCGCPHCKEEFEKDPDHYVSRLEWSQIPSDQS